MYADNEIYFDVNGSGAFAHEGYALMGGPGRAVFDRETYKLLRLEPLGGAPSSDAPLIEEVPPVEETAPIAPESSPEPLVTEEVQSPVVSSTGG